MSTSDYNVRLFEGNFIRSIYHNYRFKLVSKIIEEEISESENYRLGEIGCFDARILSFLDIDKIDYCGIDLDWESGLSLAKEKFSKNPNIAFYNADIEEDLASFLKKSFDTLISLETFEHLSPEQIDVYIKYINETRPNNCYLTVPNEIGFIFIIKKMFQKFVLKSEIGYSTKEFICQSLGLVGAVQRKEHKGFSYYRLKRFLDDGCLDYNVRFSNMWLLRIFTPTILIEMNLVR